MQPIQIRTFDKLLDIRLTGEHVTLPDDLRDKVQEHWQELVSQKPKLHNGEVFTVVSLEEDDAAIHIRLAETDYAHYLYANKVGDLGDYSVRIIHPAALVIAEDQMIFGTMGQQTSLAGIMQCCGGGIDRGAVQPDGSVAIDQTMTMELWEELGLRADDARITSFKPTYLKYGGPTGKMTLVYVVKLNQTCEQFQKDYAAFTAKLQANGEEPEFEKLICLRKDKETVEAFVNQHESELNEYMPILLRTAVDH